MTAQRSKIRFRRHQFFGRNFMQQEVEQNKKRRRRRPYIITTTLVLNRTNGRSNTRSFVIFFFRSLCVQFNERGEKNGDSWKVRRIVRGLCTISKQIKEEATATTKAKEEKKNANHDMLMSIEELLTHQAFEIYSISTCVCTNRGLDEVDLHKIA